MVEKWQISVLRHLRPGKTEILANDERELNGTIFRLRMKHLYVYVEGQLETRKWQDQAGNDRYTTEVVLRPYRGELTMLDSRNSGSDIESSDYSQLENKSQNSEISNNNQTSYASNDLDDEIPF